MLRILFFTWVILFSSAQAAEPVNQQPESIATSELQNFSVYPESVKKIIDLVLTLATKNLTYQYGSADPAAGGMDCSGTVYYLLNTMGIKEVPRSSDLIYKWVNEKGHFYAVKGNHISSTEFSHLMPGDLLFWNGTYEIKREFDVTHVMIYIGKNKAGQLLMAGASNGRAYKGRKIYGVSVFDFQLPDVGSKSNFLGYSCTPGINCPKKSL